MLLHLTQLLNNFLWFSRCRFLNRIGGKFVGKAPSFEPSSAIQINKYLYISQVLFQNISILSKAVNFLAPISSRKDYLKIKLEVFFGEGSIVSFKMLPWRIVQGDTKSYQETEISNLNL